MTALFALNAVDNISCVAVKVLLQFNLVFSGSGLDNLAFLDVGAGNTILSVALEHASSRSFRS